MIITVRPSQPEDIAPAAKLLFQRLPEPERTDRTQEFIAAILHGEISPDGILIAECDGEISGAVLSSLQPDKTAFVWPPEIHSSKHAEAVAKALLSKLAAQLDAQGAWLGQCILDTNERNDREVLSRNGFGHLTNLIYLKKSLDGRDSHFRDDAKTTQPAVRFESYTPGQNQQRFVRMLEQTYRNTLDCPELSGARSPEEAFHSHELSGEFDPRNWMLFQANGSDIGVLLVNNHPDQNAREIVYLGVADAFRGRGFGRAMLETACRSAWRAGCDSILVAVDCRNRFARTIYDAMGFVEFATRAVHVRVSPERVRLRRNSSYDGEFNSQKKYFRVEIP